MQAYPTRCVSADARVARAARQARAGSACRDCARRLVVHLCRAQCALSLEDINLRGTCISDEGVMCVVRCCPGLRVLDIGAWPYSRFRGIRSVSDVSLFFIAQCAALRGEEFALESVCIAGRR